MISSIDLIDQSDQGRGVLDQLVFLAAMQSTALNFFGAN